MLEEEEISEKGKVLERFPILPDKIKFLYQKLGELDLSKCENEKS